MVLYVDESQQSFYEVVGFTTLAKPFPGFCGCRLTHWRTFVLYRQPPIAPQEKFSSYATTFITRITKPGAVRQ